MNWLSNYAKVFFLTYWVIQGVILLFFHSISVFIVIMGILLIIIAVLSYLLKNKNIQLVLSIMLILYLVFSLTIIFLMFLFTVKVKDGIPIYILVFLIPIINLLVSISLLKLINK